MWGCLRGYSGRLSNANASWCVLLRYGWPVFICPGRPVKIRFCVCVHEHRRWPSGMFTNNAPLWGGRSYRPTDRTTRVYADSPRASDHDEKAQSPHGAWVARYLAPTTPPAFATLRRRGWRGGGNDGRHYGQTKLCSKGVTETSFISRGTVPK